LWNRIGGHAQRYRVEIHMRLLGIDQGRQLCDYACGEIGGNRGRCPRTPGILRFSPIARHKRKAMPPRGRHRPCYWPAAALGLLASRALPSAAVLSDYPQHLWAARGTPAHISCYWPKAINAGGLGAEPPRSTRVQCGQRIPMMPVLSGLAGGLSVDAQFNSK
jgi:hypothetical protein